jgi:tetratricopeptide (TPR) repeat protein
MIARLMSTRSTRRGRARPPAAPAEKRRPPASARAAARARAAAPGAPPAAAPPEAGERAAKVLWAGLALCALARAALAFVPSMWAWSLNVARFVDPLTAWLPWALAALALVPVVARRAEPAAAWLGDALARAPVASTLACALAAALLVWLHPDHARYVGDFLLRQGTVEEAMKPGALYPQALPLDVALHHTLPSRMLEHGLASPNDSARLLGALEAAALAALAAAFARALALRGAAALAVASAVFFTGALGLFTGYSKAFAEATLLAVAVGTFGLRAVREGRGLLALGLVVAAGVTLHRGALAVLPAAGLAWGLALARDGRGLLRRPANAAGLAIPVVTLAVMLPRVIAIIVEVDPVHFASASVMHQGGPLAAAFAGTRPADLLNLVGLLAPLAPLALAIAVAFGRDLPRGREALFLATLALPFVAVMPFLHPVQGLFRDWDDFASTGGALAVLAAWFVAEALRAAPRRAWLGVAVVLGVAAPAVQWLTLHQDVERGLARARAFLDEPPRRDPAERAHMWDYLGVRNYHLERWQASAAAFREATTTAPSPRMLHQWAIASTMANDLRTAQVAYRRVLERDSSDYTAWLGLAAVSSRVQEFEESRRALRVMMRLRPDDPDPPRLLQAVNAEEAKQRALRGSAPGPPAGR